MLDQFLPREAPAADRIEHALARLTAMYAQVHLKDGAKQPNVSDYLPHLKAWPDTQDDHYSDVDKEVLAELL